MFGLVTVLFKLTFHRVDLPAEPDFMWKHRPVIGKTLYIVVCIFLSLLDQIADVQLLQTFENPVAIRLVVFIEEVGNISSSILDQTLEPSWMCFGVVFHTISHYPFGFVALAVSLLTGDVVNLVFNGNVHPCLSELMFSE